MAVHHDFTLLLLAPGVDGAFGELEDAVVAARVAAAARATDLDLGGVVKAKLLARQAGRRAVRFETSPDRSRWGPFWLEAELGFPEFRMLRELAPSYEVTVVAYSEKLKMGWVATARQGDVSIQDLHDEPLPPEVKRLVDLLGSAAVSREITLSDAPPP